MIYTPGIGVRRKQENATQTNAFSEKKRMHVHMHKFILEIIYTPGINSLG